MLVWFNFKYYFEIAFALAKCYEPLIAGLTMLVVAEFNWIEMNQMKLIKWNLNQPLQKGE